MKAALITAFIMLSTIATFTFPVKSNVTIVKSQVTENRPFAGVINGKVVGTNLCVEYWLNPHEQPDTVTYTITKPFLLQHLGMIYSYKKTN